MTANNISPVVASALEQLRNFVQVVGPNTGRDLDIDYDAAWSNLDLIEQELRAPVPIASAALGECETCTPIRVKDGDKDLLMHQIGCPVLRGMAPRASSAHGLGAPVAAGTCPDCNQDHYPEELCPQSLVERMAVAVLGELDISHPSAPTEAALRDRIRSVLSAEASDLEALDPASLTDEQRHDLVEEARSALSDLAFKLGVGTGFFCSKCEADPNGSATNCSGEPVTACFQPGCSEPSSVVYRVLRDYSESGELLADQGDPPAGPEHRAFCEKHKGRGDCDLDDGMSNYVLVESRS